MKGASPITRKQQVETAIDEWLTQHLASSQDALKTVMLRQVTQSELPINAPKIAL